MSRKHRLDPDATRRAKEIVDHLMTRWTPAPVEVDLTAGGDVAENVVDITDVVSNEAATYALPAGKKMAARTLEACADLLAERGVCVDAVTNNITDDFYGYGEEEAS